MMKNKISYFLILFGLFIIGYQNISKRIEIISEKNKIEYTINGELSYSKKDNSDIYDIVIEIPQINLKKGIYKKNDSRNNIDKNITIHNDSDYPNQDFSNLILMAHSGSGDNAFFKDVTKLNNDSLIKIYYHDKKYTYKIEDNYEVDKNGKARIIRNENRKSITLITCSQSDKTKQLVYIGYLIDEVNY